MPAPPQTRILVAALCAASLALGACGGETAPAADAAIDPDEARQLEAGELVSTAAVELGRVSTTITASGSVAARRLTEVGAEVPGRLLEVQVDVGDIVAVDEPLFQIDPAPYLIAVREAEAAFALARAERKQAEQEAARSRELADRKVVAQERLDEDATSLEVADARVAQARARLERARHGLERTRALAPYAGSVVERRAHEGSVVQPGAVVVVLQETAVLEAVLDIPESAAEVHAGDPVRIYADELAQPFATRIRTVSDRIDPASRTYAARAPLDGASLRAGAFVRAEIDPLATTPSALVDRRGLLLRDGRTYVFRVRDGRAERVGVRVGNLGAERAQLLSGVQPGERIVVGDIVRRLADGAAVREAPAAP